MSVCSCWLLIWYDCGGVWREWFAKTQLISTCLNLTRPAIWQPPNVIMRSQVWVMKTTSCRLLKCRVELRAINPYDTALSWTSCIARAYSIKLPFKRKCGFYDLHFYHPTTSTRSLHNRLQPFLFCLLSIISCKHLMKIKIECSDYSIYFHIAHEICQHSWHALQLYIPLLPSRVMKIHEIKARYMKFHNMMKDETNKTKHLQ